MTTAAMPIAISITPPQKSLLVRVLGISDAWIGSSLGVVPAHAGTHDHGFQKPFRRWSWVPACAGTTDCTLRVLFRLDVPLLHHALPFLHFLFHERAELGRAHLHDLGTFLGKLLLHIGRRLHGRD